MDKFTPKQGDSVRRFIEDTTPESGDEFQFCMNKVPFKLWIGSRCEFGFDSFYLFYN